MGYAMMVAVAATPAAVGVVWLGTLLAPLVTPVPDPVVEAGYRHEWHVWYQAAGRHERRRDRPPDLPEPAIRVRRPIVRLRLRADWRRVLAGAR